MSELTTQAIVFEDVGKASVQEVELPAPTADDIVVETEVSGVSVGTERWAFIGKRKEIAFPNIPGYMGIGRVREVGERAGELGYKTGQRVNFFASRLRPPHDRSWMGSHLARAVVRVTDVVQPPGFDVHRCVVVPEGASPEGVSITGLCAVALRGIEMATIPAGASVLVCGLGCIGQYAAQIARLKGARVCVVDIDAMRLDVARQLGADWAINPAERDLAEEARRIAPEGFDIIIDTSSRDDVLNSLFPLLKLRGKLIFQGWYPPPSSLDLNVLHGRMPTCYAPCSHSDTAVATAMRWVAAGVLDTESLITHRARPEDAPEMYRMIAENDGAFLGIMFDWRDGSG